jgi:hypothetical protein
MRDYQWLLALGFVVTAMAVQARIRENDRIAAATAQVRHWAEKLDSETTATGVYCRHDGNRLPEIDPWGTPLRVGYSQGGLAEVVMVSSAGADRIFDTADDIERAGLTMNFKGIGEGVKKNAGEIAKRTARGAVHGAIVGIKDGVKEAFKKDHAAEEIATN